MSQKKFTGLTDNNKNIRIIIRKRIDGTASNISGSN